MRAGLAASIWAACPGGAMIWAIRPRAKTSACGARLLVGVLGAVAEGLELLVEPHCGERLLVVEGADPLAGALDGEFAALVPDEPGEDVPVLAGEVDALAVALVQLLGGLEPLLAVLGRVLQPGVREEVLVVDHHAVGGVPRDAELGSAHAPRVGEPLEPVLAAPLAQALQGELGEAAGLDVLGHLGVADLDDVGAFPRSCRRGRR
ncbi:hypothetical protein GCM10020254_16210 [Streptomyces goshikiensis]